MIIQECWCSRFANIRHWTLLVLGSEQETLILNAAAFCNSKIELELEWNQEKHDLCLCITVFDVLSTWRYVKIYNILKRTIYQLQLSGLIRSSVLLQILRFFLLNGLLSQWHMLSLCSLSYDRSHKHHDFRLKNIFERNICILVFSTTFFSETALILRARCCPNCS